VSEPQRLTVRHISRYRYSEPVGFGEHRMMFRPRSSHDLRLVTTQLRISPEPEHLRWLHDVFDNSVAVATFGKKAKELVFESVVQLDHFEAPSPDYSLERYAAVYPFAYTNEEASDLVNARNRLEPDADIDAWARRFLSTKGPTGTMALLRAMTQEIKGTFKYTRRIEKGVNRPADTLRDKSGSCRDFAVFMMDAVRSLGLAARFVSGYIFVPDHDVTQGGGSTHAWLQIYLPGAGWVDFDPTNSIVGNRHLIRVAVAWNH
jgi:transglutaminase-like putative cysteine protease